jgi:curved DNA-binding protein CbpA
MMYFAGIETLEELKSRYHKLVMENHPDKGGDTATMQAINAEYEKVFPKVKNYHKNKEGETYQKETNETAGYYMDIMEKLIKMHGIKIEIIGCFIWLSGDTKKWKEDIKALRFKWNNHKKMWYLAPSWWKPSRNKKPYDINTIRSMYGSTEVSMEEQKQLSH